jgi:hypothetical protein
MSCISSLELGSPLHAVSHSARTSLAIVGGRDVVKIVALGGEGVLELKTLKVAAKGDVKFRLVALRCSRSAVAKCISHFRCSITDVAWSSVSTTPGLCAAALNNGGVAVWDVAHQGSWSGALSSASKLKSLSLHDRSEKLLTEHQRTVNRICWHPTDPHVMLSCSMDNTVKMWDKRVTGRYCQATFRPRNDAIRDVQFSPFHVDRFAAVLDNGQLQIWDRRRSSQAELKVQAHLQSSMALDWHPTKEWIIATASRDRTARVWDLSTVIGAWDSRPQPHTSQANATAFFPSPVSRVKWRPNMPSQLAACCGSGPCSSDIFVQDITEPYIPWRVLEGEKDVCMDFGWCDSQLAFSLLEQASERMDEELGEEGTRSHSYSDPCAYIVACGKDGCVRFHSVDRAMNPRGDVSPCVVTLGAAGGVACVHDPVFDAADPSTDTLLKEVPTGPSVVLSKFWDAGLSIGGDDHVSLTASKSKSPPRSAHRSISVGGRSGLGISPALEDEGWSGASWGNEEFRKVVSTSPLQEDIPSEAYPPFRRPQALIVVWEPQTPPSLPSRESVTEFTIGELLGYDPATIEFLALTYVLHGYPARQLCAINAAAASSCGLPGLSHVWRVLHILLAGSETSFDPYAVAATVRQSDGQVEDVWGAEIAAEGGHSMSGLDSIAASVASKQTSPGEFTMPEALALLEEQSQPKTSGFAFGEHASEENRANGTAAADGPRSSQHAIQWLWRDVVADFLRQCVECGDSQHCVAMCEIVKTWEKEQCADSTGKEAWHRGLGVEEWQVREWYMSYIELLHRLQLWEVATDLINTSDDIAVAEQNRKGTGVHTACSACSTLSGPHCRCPKCSSVVSECSLCLQPVRGLFVWCPGCSHGGHLPHMQEWFSEQSVCPTGCGHKVSKNSTPSNCHFVVEANIFPIWGGIQCNLFGKDFYR